MRDDNKMRKELFVIAIIFLTGGFLMFFNLIASGIPTLDPKLSYSQSPALWGSFVATLVLGSIGIIFFAVGLENLIHALVRGYDRLGETVTNTPT